jgi:phage holin, LL-H family
MDQTMVEILKLVIMAGVALIVVLFRRDLVPFIQSKATAEQLRTAQELAEMFVYMAQQIFGDKSGAERKKIVKQALTDALQNSGIEMTDQFVDDMIEAAVKGLRIAESARTVTVNTEITSESGKDG